MCTLPRRNVPAVSTTERARSCSPAAVRALLTDPALDVGLPPSDVASAINNGIARGHDLVGHAAELFDGTVVAVEYPAAEGGAA